MVSFDPYLNWLGIPPHEQPANFYRLLGVVLFESNPEVIEQAADRQSLRVGAYQSGPQGEFCQQLLSEIAMARLCLLDAQQKASYDGQLLDGLARRGERTVAAAPPPAPLSGPPQFGPSSPQFGAPSPQFGPPSPQFGPPPQFGPQLGMGPVQPGIGMQRPMTMPGLPPMPSAMPGVAAMPGPAAMSMPPPQPVMQMPPSMASAPPGFASAMQYPSVPATMPAAMPFPAATPTASVAGSAAAALPAAGPAESPAPIDELESLTSQPARRRFLKKKTDYTKEIIIGSVVTAAGVVLFVTYAIVTNQDPLKHGYEGIEAEKPKPVESVRAAMDSAKKKFIEDLQKKEKEKEKEREKKAAADQAVRSKKRSSATGNGDVSLPKAYDFGRPSRAMDSPGPGRPIRSGPQPNGQGNPDDPGGIDDPVMEKPPSP